MNPVKKQEFMIKRLQATGNLTREYIVNEITIRNKRIGEIELDIEHIKLSKTMQIKYIEHFKLVSTPTQIQKIVSRINVPTLQINMAGLCDSLYELIDQLKEEIEIYNNILTTINDQ